MKMLWFKRIICHFKGHQMDGSRPVDFSRAGNGVHQKCKRCGRVFFIEIFRTRSRA